MDAVLCIIFSVFAVYGMYSAHNVLVRFIDRKISRRGPSAEGDPSKKEDAPPGCLGCGCCFWEEVYEDEKEAPTPPSDEDEGQS